MIVAMGHKHDVNCRYFASGLCRAGVRCNYVHRKQTNSDERYLNQRVSTRDNKVNYSYQKSLMVNQMSAIQ